MSSNIPNLTTATFDETIQGSTVPVIVDFWAEWCGPCKQIAPILAEIADEYPDDVLIAKLNIDEHPEVVTRYNILSIPTLLGFKDGEVVVSVKGAKPKHDLIKEFEAFLPSR